MKTMKMLLLKCYFNRFLDKMLQAHARYEYLEVNGIFDVGDEGFRASLFHNRPDDLVHYNKGIHTLQIELLRSSRCKDIDSSAGEDGVTKLGNPDYCHINN